MSPTTLSLDNIFTGAHIPSELKDALVYSTEANASERKITVTVVSKSLIPYKVIEDFKDYVKEKFDVGVFNLGYLPGGDKRITTLRETTLPAVDAALDLLNDGGIILIAISPGHAEGEIEGKLLTEMLSTLDRKQICVSRFTILNSPTSPYFIAVEKK